MIWFNLLTSWRKKSWQRHANSATSMINSIRFLGAKTKTTTWLPLQNNRFQLCIEENGSKKLVYLSDTVELLRASGRKQVLMERTLGASSEFISSRKLNNSISPTLKIHGKCLNRWLAILSSSINLWVFPIVWSPSFQELSMMRLQKNMTLKLGSLDIMLIESWFLAPTALIISLVVWEFVVEVRKKM